MTALTPNPSPDSRRGERVRSPEDLPRVSRVLQLPAITTGFTLSLPVQYPC